MNTKRTLSLGTTAVTTVMAALLAACGTTKLPEPTAAAPVESRTPVAADTSRSGATPAAAPQSQVATVDLSKGAAGAAGAALPGQRIVYFDFDSFVIKDDFKPLLDGYARVLSTDKAKRLVIEGHTDERGGREYNLALGQKRAAAVVKSLTLLGATDVQLEAVSFGEEKPAAQGSDESAWSKNRRAELKDR
jgi:peptidoglycan-associated lipoprotein